MVLALPVFIGCPLASVSHSDKGREKKQLFRTHLLGVAREREGDRITAVMCGDCLQQQRPVGSCYSPRWVVHSPRGISPQQC